jgi:GntR family transcriptional regulator
MRSCGCRCQARCAATGGPSLAAAGRVRRGSLSDRPKIDKIGGRAERVLIGEPDGKEGGDVSKRAKITEQRPPAAGRTAPAVPAGARSASSGRGRNAPPATGRPTRSSQVAARIVRGIRTARFPVGSLLPSEPTLAREYGVSRSTLRAALFTLQGLGLVERRQGAGTRVRASEAPPVYVHSMQASGDLMQFAGPSHRRVREVEQLIADECMAPRLDNRPGRHWIRIGQTRHLSDVEMPVCWTDVYLPIEYADLVDEIPSYDGLIYTLIEQRHGVTIREIVQSIRAVDVPPRLRSSLGADANTKALELTRRYRNDSQQCEMVSISVLPATNYTYEIKLTRQA